MAAGGFHSSSSTGEKPKVTLGLLRRVLGYSKPYRGQLVAMLVLIFFLTGLGLLTPLILRDLIDKTIPSGNLSTAGPPGDRTASHPGQWEVPSAWSSGA